MMTPEEIFASWRIIPPVVWEVKGKGQIKQKLGEKIGKIKGEISSSLSDHHCPIFAIVVVWPYARSSAAMLLRQSHHQYP